MTKHFIRLTQRMKRALSPHGTRRPWETFPRPSALRESTISLSDEEAAWVALESLRLMRSRRKEEARKRALGIPPPPTPGKICYAVYM
ncbi:MAG: hypothetical protein J6J74_02720 [Elusimicrobiaceae bacterium]|nr:hypothetical protein [Elusimicrobiaceae bacterium]MBP3513391.1 hypothetical protein [Elusimicrobiaceae bacterium]